MEDLLKYLLIVGIIIVGIVKEVNKNKSKKAPNKRPVPSTPPMDETAPDAVPIPEAWGKMFPSQDIFQPIPIEKPSQKHTQKHKSSPKPKTERKQEISSQFGTIGNRFDMEGQRSTPPSDSHTPHEETSAPDGEFTIHTAEEARRAIIWGEILQRKY